MLGLKFVFDGKARCVDAIHTFQGQMQIAWKKPPEHLEWYLEAVVDTPLGRVAARGHSDANGLSIEVLTDLAGGILIPESSRRPRQYVN